MHSIKFRPEDEGFGEEDSKAADEYLSKLAQSILSKDKPKGRPSGAENKLPDMKPPAPPQQPPRPPSSSSVPRPPSSPAVAQPQVAAPRQEQHLAAAQKYPWKREVEFFDESGNLLPGTILVLEDGSMGVFKESNTSKEYDIVYMLKQNGRAIPQGMPLYAYEKEPIGRLTAGVLDQLSQSGRWERDMIVFHLVKYLDRKHIPKVTEEDVPIASATESFSSWAIKKLNIEPPAQTADEKKPSFIRGRRFTIKFGANAWEAVFWGKDELGHIVAHDTHDKWTLMHLDLNRFKDTLEFGEMVGPDVIKAIERDHTGR